VSDLVSVDWMCLVGHSVYQLASYTERIQDWIGWSTITWSVEQGVNSYHHLAAGYSSTNEQAQRSSLDPSKRHVKDLGVVLEGQLIMANHVAALSQSCFWYIRQLKSIKQSLTPAALKTLVYVFIISRIDYAAVHSQTSVLNWFRGCKPLRTLLTASSLGPYDTDTESTVCDTKDNDQIKQTTSSRNRN